MCSQKFTSENVFSVFSCNEGSNTNKSLWEQALDCAEGKVHAVHDGWSHYLQVISLLNHMQKTFTLIITKSYNYRTLV